jgi:hypothetical protein
LVTGSVEESDQVGFAVSGGVSGLISADVLGDAAGFASHDLGLPDVVEEGRLAMVNMPHYYNNGRANNQVFLICVRHIGVPDSVAERGGVDNLMSGL